MMRTGYLVGRFDMVNVRDLDVIAEAGTHCDQLVLLVLDDAMVVALTGRPPVVPLGERIAIAGELTGVAAAIEVKSPVAPMGADAVVMAAADETLPRGWQVARLRAARTSRSDVLRRWQCRELVGEPA